MLVESRPLWATFATGGTPKTDPLPRAAAVAWLSLRPKEH